MHLIGINHARHVRCANQALRIHFLFLPRPVENLGPDRQIAVDGFTLNKDRVLPVIPGHHTGGLIGAKPKSEALAAVAKGVWTAFPDFTIELLNVGEIEAGVGALHWRASGTNTGSGGGHSEPTGRSVSFQGASIVRLEGDKIRSDHAYFDRKGLDEQLAPK